MSEHEKWKKRVDVAMQEDGSQWLPVSECPSGDMEMRRRPGRFKIASNFDFAHELMMVLSQVAITRCEHLFNENELEYIGYSEHFRVVEHGAIIPEYLIVFTKENHAIVSFEFQEQ
jgi:hypothetical protein